MTPEASFNDLLARLGHELDDGTLHLRDAAHAVCEHVCAALACSRASAWVLVGDAGARVMSRIGGFDASAGLALREPVSLQGAELAGYFDALTRNATYVCADAPADPRLNAMRSASWLPDTRALLDATVGVNGSTWGVLRCEQRGAPRRWTAAEVRLLKRFADDISLRRARRRAREAVAWSFRPEPRVLRP